MPGLAWVKSIKRESFQSFSNSLWVVFKAQRWVSVFNPPPPPNYYICQRENFAQKTLKKKVIFRFYTLLFVNVFKRISKTKMVSQTLFFCFQYFENYSFKKEPSLYNVKNIYIIWKLVSFSNFFFILYGFENKNKNSPTKHALNFSNFVNHVFVNAKG